MELSYVQMAMTPPRVCWQEGERFAVDGDGSVYLVLDGVYELVATLEGRHLHGHAQIVDGEEHVSQKRPWLRGPRLQEPGRDVVVQVGDEPAQTVIWAGLAVQRGRLVVMGPDGQILAEQAGSFWRRPGQESVHWHVFLSALPVFRPLPPHQRSRLSPLAARPTSGRFQTV